MKVLAVFGFVILSAVCVSCLSITKDKLSGCISNSGAVQLVLTLDKKKMKEQGPEVGFNIIGCVVREAGYIDAQKKLDEAKIVSNFVNILDTEFFNVEKIKERVVACVRQANKETGEGHIIKSFMACRAKDMMSFVERMQKNIQSIKS